MAPPPPATDDPDRTVVGRPASPGRATGTARVITSPDDLERLGPGDVLVASTTTPEWTSAFGLAAAVVTDVGSTLSHTAIVAREFGIPAVTATGDGTNRIPDGTTVTVDGTTGVVHLH